MRRTDISTPSLRVLRELVTQRSSRSRRFLSFRLSGVKSHDVRASGKFGRNETSPLRVPAKTHEFDLLHLKPKTFPRVQIIIYQNQIPKVQVSHRVEYKAFWLGDKKEKERKKCFSERKRSER